MPGMCCWLFPRIEASLAEDEQPRLQLVFGFSAQVRPSHLSRTLRLDGGPAWEASAVASI